MTKTIIWLQTFLFSFIVFFDVVVEAELKTTVTRRPKVANQPAAPEGAAGAPDCRAYCTDDSGTAVHGASCFACLNGQLFLFENGNVQNPAQQPATNKQKQAPSAPATSDAEMILSQAVYACEQSKNNAQLNCDKESDPGIKGVVAGLSKFAVGAGSMGMGACSKLAPLLAGANASVVYFQQKCASTRNTCMQTCEKSRATASSLAGMNAGYLAMQQTVIDSMYDECKKLEANLQQANQAVQNIASSIPGALNCANATDVNVSSYCASNPSAAGCGPSDCSNPSVAASNPICICKNNPNSPTCSGPQAKAAFGSGSADMQSLGTAPNGPPGGSSLDSDSMFSTLDYQGNGMTPSQGAAEDVGGKKGGGANLGDGGGGGGGPGGGENHKGGDANPVAVNAGFRGGGGGGGWGGGGYGGGNYGGAGNAAGNANPQGGPNLRDFLPNGKLDPRHSKRGLAGISGPDGITGPHSDIWKKIQNRYQVQVERDRLIP